MSSISIKIEYHVNIECKDIPTNELPDRINEVPKWELMINVYRKYLSQIIIGKMKTVFAKIMAKLWQKSPKIEKGFNPFRAKPLLLVVGRIGIEPITY